MATRFEFCIMAVKANFTAIKMMMEIDEIIKPESGKDTLIVMESYPLQILDVSIAPTMDPMIFVTGEAIYMQTEEEADKLALKFTNIEGWRRV